LLSINYANESFQSLQNYISAYESCLKDMNYYQSITVLSLPAYTMEMFGRLLSAAAKFQYVSELHILFAVSPMEETGEIGKLQEAFPAFMKSVRTVYIRPRGRVHQGFLQHVRTAELPYRVVVQRYFDDSFIPKTSVISFLYDCYKRPSIRR